jgi:hypothetical protein
MHISETVGIALIAVAGTLGSGGLSYLAARRNTEVQLGGVRAEMERLKATHEEEIRRERQEAYYGFVTASHALKQFVFGMRGAVNEEAYVELGKTFGDEYIRVCFLGSEDVLTAADEMVAAFGKVVTKAEEENKGGASLQDRLEDSFKEHAAEWRVCEAALILRMKEDLELTRA